MSERKTSMEYLSCPSSEGIVSSMLKSFGVVKVDGKTFNSKSIIIATGSEPSQLKGIEVDEKTIVSSTGALSLKNIPKTIFAIFPKIFSITFTSPVSSYLSHEMHTV